MNPAIKTVISNSKYNNKETIICVAKSTVGVIIAANITIKTTICFLAFFSNFMEIMLIFIKKSNIIGKIKIIPDISIKTIVILKYSERLIKGKIPSDFEKLIRN